MANGSGEALFHIHNVSKVYCMGDVQVNALRGVDFDLWAEEFVVILGIEEQRVNIIVDFTAPPAALGDGYRVLARIVTWSGEEVLKVPVSALFRQGESWCVFAVHQGRAQRRTVTVGHRNQLEAEILGGLVKGETVVLHPSSQLDDGLRVKVR